MGLLKFQWNYWTITHIEDVDKLWVCIAWATVTVKWTKRNYYFKYEDLYQKISGQWLCASNIYQDKNVFEIHCQTFC